MGSASSNRSESLLSSHIPLGLWQIVLIRNTSSSQSSRVSVNSSFPILTGADHRMISFVGVALQDIIRIASPRKFGSRRKSGPSDHV